MQGAADAASFSQESTPSLPADGNWGYPNAGDWAMQSGMDALGGGMMEAEGGMHNPYADAMNMAPRYMPEGPAVTLPALSLRQPFASLTLYGVKQLEARNRPAMRQLSGVCPP